MLTRKVPLGFVTTNSRVRSNAAPYLHFAYRTRLRYRFWFAINLDGLNYRVRDDQVGIVKFSVLDMKCSDKFFNGWLPEAEVGLGLPISLSRHMPAGRYLP